MAGWFSAWLRRPLRRRLRALRGQAIIYMAVALTALVGRVGLVLDGGTMFVLRGRLQNSVDAAALAGAQGLPTAANAESIACAYIDLNPVSAMTGAQCSGKATVGITENYTKITVTAYRSWTPVLLPVVGISGPTNVRAKAVVKIGSPASGCVFPFFIQAKELATPWTLVPLARGNLIDIGSGASAIKNAMAGLTCKSGKVNAADIDLKPGESAQIESGWEERLKNVALSSCPNGDVIGNYRVAVGDGKYEVLPALNPTNCPRLVVLPVLPNAPGGGSYAGNEKGLSLQGFAAFWIRDYCTQPTCSFSYDGGVTINKGAVWGYFVPLNVPAETYTTYNPDFGTKVVVMTE
jgi:Flp pilus assembly protein TadG